MLSKMTGTLNKWALWTLVAATSACANGTSNLKLATYYDRRETVVVTTTGRASGLPFETKLFGFANLGAKAERYLELQLSKRMISRIGIITEYSRDFASNSSTNRLGLVYEPPLPSAFQNDAFTIKYQPISTNSRGAQFSFSGRKNFNLKTYLEGYFDYNSRPGKVVSEIQFGRNLTSNWFGVIEFRHNGFRADPRAVAIGLEWKFR